ncbi:MAG: hypothetical protein HOQ12_06535 [Gemmatimonadaceae bacterium]|nr:hypothetical protein [Gemmatimonadaceae bacterium]
MHRSLILAFLVGALAACGRDAAAPRRDDPAAPRAELVYEGFPSGTSELLRIAADGVAPARMLPAGSVAMDPEPSPDGTRIVFVVAAYDAGTGDIWMVNADGTGLRRLTDDPELDDSPSWSPDGRRIVFRSYRSMRDGELWTLDVEGGALTNLTPAQGSAIIDHRRPAWSPDGTRIAFATNEGGDWGIWTMRADGSDRRQLTNTIDLDAEPAWSPDARFIAFRRSNQAQGSDIMIVPAAGGDAVRLAVPGEQRTPGWHPDGTRIAFASQVTLAERPELFTMRPDGGDLQLVTREDGWGGGLNPDWRRTDR